MMQLRAVGIPLAVLGGVLGFWRFGRRRRLRAVDIMRLDERSFNERMRTTGMEAQVRAALARIDRGSA